METQVIITFKLKSDQVDAFKEHIRKIIPDTRSFEGCKDVGFYFNSDDETDLVVFETWESRADYEKYFNSRTETGALEAIASYLAGEPSIRFLTKSDI